MNEEALKYPIGKFAPQDTYNNDELSGFIDRISTLPERMQTLVKAFDSKQFDTTYREGGWTARQVLHHIADSHMNAYIRFKWTLTETTPTIKAYNEKLWAQTPDVNEDPRVAIDLLKALHVKWVSLLKGMTTEDFKKEYLHPETKKSTRLDRVTAMYAWHGDHHLGHLKIVADKSH